MTKPTVILKYYVALSCFYINVDNAAQWLSLASKRKKVPSGASITRRQCILFCLYD